MLRYTLLLLFSSLILSANYSYYKIVLGSFSKIKNADAEIEFYKKKLINEEKYIELMELGNTKFHIYNGKKYHTVSLRPFQTRAEAVEILNIIHKYNKSPYLSRFKTKEPVVFKEKVSSSSSVMMIIEEVKEELIEVKAPLKVLKAREKEPVKKIENIEKTEYKDQNSVKEVKKEKIKKDSAPVKVEAVKSVEYKKDTEIKKDEFKSKIVKETPKVKEPEVKSVAPVQTQTKTDIIKSDIGTSSNLVNNMLGYFPYFIILTLLGLVSVLIKQNRMLKEENRELLEETVQNASIAKTKDEFLTKMSHEIRTPMNAIVGFSHILLETKLDTNQLGHLRNIQNAADLLLSVINDILNFSKIEHGDTKVQKLLFNINDVLDQISDKMGQNARDKDIELIFEIANNVPSRIVGDEEKFHDVILNLVSNAIKYTNSGEVILKLKRLDSEAENIALECKVSDTGIGIKQEALSKLFDSFVQVDNSSARQYDGMGLGLAIVKEYVHLMGGDIKVESEFSKGSVFTFTVCFDSPAKIDPRNYRLPDKSIMYKKVLVVDDNTSAAGSLQRMIAYYHYHADIVNTEAEAITLLRDHEYDILCIDSKLLDESLEDTIQRYKEFSNAKIVVLENDVVKKLGSSVKGIDAELQKPFSQQDIFNTIIELYSEIPQHSEQKKATKEGVAQFAGKTILLAEDNKINQSVIKSLLVDTGINLLIANNGKEAIDILYENVDTVDMIFMDISMPVMNGYDAAITIRNNNRFSNLPIIALTANILPSDIEKSKRSGMQEHIGKPFNVTAFYDAIIKYLSADKLEDVKIKAAVDVPAVEVEKVSESIKPIETKEEISNISVLDRSKGLELVGNDEELLQELLEEFVQMYKESVSELAKLIEAQDYSTGQKLSHDIKGVSANLGLMDVHESVKALEMTFKAQDSEDAKVKLERYSRALKLATDEIQK